MKLFRNLVVIGLVSGAAVALVGCNTVAGTAQGASRDLHQAAHVVAPEGRPVHHTRKRTNQTVVKKKTVTNDAGQTTTTSKTQTTTTDNPSQQN